MRFLIASLFLIAAISSAFAKPTGTPPPLPEGADLPPMKPEDLDMAASREISHKCGQGGCQNTYGLGIGYAYGGYGYPGYASYAGYGPSYGGYGGYGGYGPGYYGYGAAPFAYGRYGPGFGYGFGY